MGHRNNRQSATVRINGAIRAMLREVARGDSSMACRARGILDSGQNRVDERVLNMFMRTVGI